MSADSRCEDEQLCPNLRQLALWYLQRLSKHNLKLWDSCFPGLDFNLRNYTYEKNVLSSFPVKYDKHLKWTMETSDFL